MATIAEHLIKISADVGDILDKLGTTDEALDRTADLVEKAFTGLSIVAFGAAMKKAATAVVDLTEQVGAQAERIGQLAEITGLSEQRLQEWGAVFQQAGGSIENLTQGTRVLSQHMVAAAEGSEESRAAFARLGLDATQIGSDTETAFTAVIDQLAKMPPGFERTAVATQLLGRGAANLLPVFAQGSEHFKRMGEEARTMGAVLTGPQLDALRATDDAFDRLKLASEGFGKQVAASFSPAVTIGIQTMADATAFVTRVFQETVVAATTLTARFVALVQHAIAIGRAINDLSFFTEQGRDALYDRLMAIEAEKEAIIRNVREEQAKRAAVEDSTAATQRGTQALASQEAIAKQIIERTSQMVATLELAGKIQERLGRESVTRETERQAHIKLTGDIQEKEARRIIAGQTAINQAEELGRQIRQRELAENAKLADSAFNLAKAKYDAESGFFRDTEALRQAKLAAINADEQAQLAQLQLTEQQKTTIMMNAEAQRMQIAQQFPTFWQQQLLSMQQAAQFTWATIQTQFSSALTNMIMGMSTWQQFFNQVLATILNAVINFAIQLMVQWALQQAFKQTTDTAMLASHTAAEIAKTTATTTQEGARLGIVALTNKAMVAGVLTTLAAIAAVGNAAMAALGAIVVVTALTLAAIGAALLLTVVGAPLGAKYMAAANVTLIAGGLAVAAGTTALNAAVAAATAGAAVALATPFASGGIVDGLTFGMLGERGTETVLPFDIRDLDGFGGREQHFYIIQDGRQVAHTVLRHTPRVAYLHGM